LEKDEVAHRDKTAHSQVIKLADLVQYQEGAVISREIIMKKTGTVTLFAFDKGEGLSEHTTPFDAGVYVIEGEVEVSIDGERFHLSGGDMIIMPADRPHGLRAIERFKMLLIMIRS